MPRCLLLLPRWFLLLLAIPTSAYTPVPTTTKVAISTYAPSSTSSTCFTSFSSANPHWSTVPSSGEFSTSGFGKRTKTSGSGGSYMGNMGSSYGSNINSNEATEASNYQYHVESTGSRLATGRMDGWYGNACHEFSIDAGETKYYAFDSESQGGRAAKGPSIPIDQYDAMATLLPRVNLTLDLWLTLAGLASLFPPSRVLRPGASASTALTGNQ
ncbi:hypothetical protein ASPSYDRAFT_1170524 [Aspergillus sydowii CBS 593.65]|uniref:GH16 domain-containing protein n=1 Tax=Aspergillus sydowii CBS 593.65 TaxID=1036612 RepID=A0A1L9SY22_9EURO|nr:uncharacterized protein ASPSYDRAFT_1170524 [Aspergillus sydowii CBS 593.65]OJJ52069.1 hypothetical protein ASPSYDRAFT_1170524 [Aspergillus sydowii CBS 593.65]